MLTEILKEALRSGAAWFIGGVVSISASIKFLIDFLGDK